MQVAVYRGFRICRSVRGFFAMDDRPYGPFESLKRAKEFIVDAGWLKTSCRIGG